MPARKLWTPILIATALLLSDRTASACGPYQSVNTIDRTGDSAIDLAPIERFVAAVADAPTPVALDVLAAALSASAVSSTVLDVGVEVGGPNSIVVGPGDEVRFEVVGLLSDDANEGLALVGFNLVFDGGDLTQAETPTGEPTPGCDDPMVNFTIPWGITNPTGYGGTVINGDLIQVGGGQNTINNTPDNAPYPIGPVLTGVAQPGGCGPAVLVTGTLTAPDAAGTYTLAVTELFANLIREGETGDPVWATEAVGVGTITNLAVNVSLNPPIPEVVLDIKPGSCPNPLNVRSRGVIPIALVGSDTLDVTAIDIESLLLTRADGVGGAIVPTNTGRGMAGRIDDVATPLDGALCDCQELEGDGFDDLGFWLSTEDVADVLELHAMPRGASVTLTISGSLLDGTPFQASDCVVITWRGPAALRRATDRRGK